MRVPPGKAEDTVFGLGIDENDPAPDGWFGPIAPVNLGNGVTYVTYWLLTPR